MKKLLAFIICLIVTASASVCSAEDALPEIPFPYDVDFGMSHNEVITQGVAAGGVVYDVTKVYPDSAKIIREPKVGYDGLKNMSIHKNWPVYSSRDTLGRYFFFDSDDKLFQYQITYKNPTPEAYVLTNDMLLEAYGETAFSGITGLTMPLPPYTLEQEMTFYDVHPAASTLLDGQIYSDKYIIDCEAWHQWLIPYGDSFLVIDHVYWRYYKDAETPANESCVERLTFTLLTEEESSYVLSNINEMIEADTNDQ